MTELLAPVRDQISFTAAIKAGADSVYFGLGRLNMRANSRGIQIDELDEIVRTAHQNNVKVYITVNSIVFDDEMKQLDRLLQQAKAAQVDAVICWDFAVIQKARQLGLNIHISTQASIANSQAASFYHKLGAQRVVLARELSLEQIVEIKNNCSVELEAFAHGAMCVSVSGRCFMSQYQSNRSANRGDCLQPCRREYLITDTTTGDELIVDNHHVMSPKDLCTLPILDKLVDAGIHTFKIEGRSRAPEYIATATAVYRQALDAIGQNAFNQQLVEELMAQLASVYNRAFSSGFYLGKPGPQGWADKPGNQATHKKIHVGKVLHYYPKVKVAFVDVVDQPISIGDTIQFHGQNTGVVECKIQELRNEDNQPIQNADRIKATFEVPERVRQNDLVYKITPATPTPPATPAPHQE